AAGPADVDTVSLHDALPISLPTFEAEVARFHEMLEAVGELLARGAPCSISTEQLLQGPFADTMTHVGQLAMLRRLADSSVAPERSEEHTSELQSRFDLVCRL